jgi:hypothetical protein
MVVECKIGRSVFGEELVVPWGIYRGVISRGVLFDDGD